MTQRICSIDACDNPASARGLCNTHYSRARRKGELPSVGQRRHVLSNLDFDSKRADCSTCGPAVEFRIRLRKNASGPSHECRMRKYERNGRRGRFSPSPADRRAARLREKYGMTVEEYQIRLEAQQGRCLICQLPHEKLAVDHCHKSGEVRGLLCRGCNLALGLMLDDPKAFERAARYLRRYAA